MYAETMPNTEDLILPMQVVRHDVFDQMIQDLKLHDGIQEERLPSLKTLYHIWQKEFSHLKTPAKTKQGRCDTCIEMAAFLAIMVQKGIVKRVFLHLFEPYT